MDKMDLFSDDKSIDYNDIAEIKEKSLKRFQVLKISIEDFDFIDNLDRDELRFYQISKIWWFGNDEFKGLTNKQKKVVFFYVVQDFSIQEIAIHLNSDKSSIYRLLERAFMKSKEISNHFFSNKK
tara:strand:+ start:1012 stop:1386 length:375 start_codon:yes stop_codon:yes gene_type:complete